MRNLCTGGRKLGGVSAKLTSQRRISPHEGQEGGSIGPASAAASFGWRNGCASPGEGIDSCRQRSQIGNPGQGEGESACRTPSKRKLEIRRYRDSDRDDVWSLHRNAIEQIEALDAGDDYYADLHDIATAYLEPAGEFLVGRVEWRIVAMGGFIRTSDGEAEIKRMRVHSECQRRGFGRAILEVLENRARKLGVEVLHLETTVQQEAANELYRKNGYTETGRGKTLGFDVIRYEKRLR